jgi:hypothetical protein
MFNLPSDPWYTYMQPFRIVLLKKMIKAQQEAAKVRQEVSNAQEEKVEHESQKNE